MFTDFSVYSRRSKLISSFGYANNMTGLTNSGIGYRADGGLREGEKGASWQNPDGTTSSLVQNENFVPTGSDNDDSASAPPPPPPPPSDPKPPERPYDPPETEEEARNRRARENQEAAQREFEQKKRAMEDARRQNTGGGGSGGGGSGGGGSGGGTGGGTGGTGGAGLPNPADFSGKPYDPSTINMFDGDNPPNFGSPSGGGKKVPEVITPNRDGSTTIKFDDGTTMTTYNIQETLQQFPAYAGQSGSSPATYPAVGTTTPITPSGAGAWITDYNSVGFMEADTIRGGSYSAPSGGLFSNTQGTNPASQVGISYPLQQDIYDTYSNVTGAGNQVYMGGSPSFNEATGQYTNVTSNPIANPNTLPTMLSEYDLFGNAGASSGLFLDTPTIKQNGVAGTSEVDAEVTAEPEQGGGFGLITIGLIALKALSVI